MNIGRRRFLRGALGAFAMGAGVIGYEQRGDADDLRLVQRDIALSGWPEEVSGVRVGQLSDLHCDCPHAILRTRRAVSLLLAQKPDVVFLTGDYISYKPRRWSKLAAEALAPLTAVPGGVFAVLGNHDWWGNQGDLVAQELTQVGFRVLRNESVRLPGAEGVWIVGLDDRSANKQDVSAALRDVPKDACKILLIHEPDYADESPPGFALQLSGHSHAGQIRLPGIPPLHCPKYGRKYPEGLQQASHHPVYTTRGIGLMGPQFRLFCPPEVTLLRLLPPQVSA